MACLGHMRMKGGGRCKVRNKMVVDMTRDDFNVSVLEAGLGPGEQSF